MIKGLDSLSNEQKELLFRVNELHTKCVGSDYKDGMEIIETWVNENNTVCARLKMETGTTIHKKTLGFNIII